MGRLTRGWVPLISGPLSSATIVAAVYDPTLAAAKTPQANQAQHRGELYLTGRFRHYIAILTQAALPLQVGVKL
jgi:hypothetical protein